MKNPLFYMAAGKEPRPPIDRSVIDFVHHANKIVCVNGCLNVFLG